MPALWRVSIVELSSSSKSCREGNWEGGANGVHCEPDCGEVTVSTMGVSACTKGGMADRCELSSKEGLNGVIGAVPSVS